MAATKVPIKCPKCSSTEHITLRWKPNSGYDPLMVKTRCSSCRTEFFTVLPAKEKAGWEVIHIGE